jgi:hypothetical protein
MAKQTFNHLSDIEVIEKYKNNPHWSTRKDIEEHFYTKFQPLIDSMSRKYKFIGSYEDNLQESYLIMLKALEWIDVNSITNSSKYSFGITLKYFLTGYFNNEFKYETNAKVIEKEMISIYQETVNHEEYTIGEIESHEENVIFNSVINQFKSLLKDTERKIWELLESGKTQRDIAIQFGKPSVQYLVKQLKIKYINFMNDNGYAIEI